MHNTPRRTKIIIVAVALTVIILGMASYFFFIIGNGDTAPKETPTDDQVQSEAQESNVNP